MLIITWTTRSKLQYYNSNRDWETKSRPLNHSPISCFRKSSPPWSSAGLAIYTDKYCKTLANWRRWRCMCVFLWEWGCPFRIHIWIIRYVSMGDFQSHVYCTVSRMAGNSKMALKMHIYTLFTGKLLYNWTIKARSGTNCGRSGGKSTWALHRSHIHTRWFLRQCTFFRDGRLYSSSPLSLLLQWRSNKHTSLDPHHWVLFHSKQEVLVFSLWHVRDGPRVDLLENHN